MWDIDCITNDIRIKNSYKVLLQVRDETYGEAGDGEKIGESHE